MTHTTYTIVDEDGTEETTDTAKAERKARNGAYVTARTQ